MSTDFRALCADLADNLELLLAYFSSEDCGTSDSEGLIARARAALAEGETVGGVPSMPKAIEDLPEQQRRWYALGWRTALSRCATPRPVLAPVDSDMIKALVKAEAALADIGDSEREPGDDLAWCERRAAEALPFVRDVLSFAYLAARPVPVAERLPGAEDCDAERRVWVHQPKEFAPEQPAWELMRATYAASNYGATHWLPAHALPLPE